MRYDRTMRQLRRMTFAAPFVMVVTAACGSGAGPGHTSGASPGGHPAPISEAQCKEITHGSACAAGAACEIATSDGCGLRGWKCEDGKWHEQMLLCNPPPPQPISPDSPAPPTSP